MQPEFKFALICCIICTSIIILSFPFYDGWLTIFIMAYFITPLSRILHALEVFFEVDFLKTNSLTMFAMMNTNVFIISYLSSKVYFLLKRWMKRQVK